jgi:hypothetical protein
MITYFFSKVIFKIIKSPTVRWKLNKIFPTVFFFPHLELSEYLLFKKICRRKEKFLEYGSGGSTIYLLKNKKDVYSVESNPEFFSYMNSIDLVKKSVDKNLLYSFIDLGPTNQWGKPLTTDNAIDWPMYYSEIWKGIDPKDKIDVIFIDGRFRVCCCLYSILKVVEYNWESTVFIIHDFWRRKKYHVVLQFLDEVKSSINLAIFKIKENVNIEEVKEKIHDNALVTA